MAVKSHKDAMNLCADGQVAQTMGCCSRPLLAEFKANDWMAHVIFWKCKYQWMFLESKKRPIKSPVSITHIKQIGHMGKIIDRWRILPSSSSVEQRRQFHGHSRSVSYLARSFCACLIGGRRSLGNGRQWPSNIRCHWRTAVIADQVTGYPRVCPLCPLLSIT